MSLHEELECATNDFDATKIDKMIALANLIDKDLG